MAEPTTLDVEMLASMTTLHPSEAIKLLKAHNNDVQAATNAYLDNPNTYSYPMTEGTWDEDAFHSDRTDVDQPVFAVDPQDTLKPSVFRSAPSRPPSRVSTRTEHLMGQTGVSISNPQEAKDLDQALKMSMMSDDNHTQTQMTGVTNTLSAHFGPATQKHYDKNWALTVPRDHTKEIWLNPEPVDRKRDGTTPVFLRPSTQGHRLPALIKILQTIPLTREAMICRNAILPDYGHDSEWWDGTIIQTPKIFHAPNENQGHNVEEVLHETQRLVAFLEETERAYGSIDSLLTLSSMSLSKDDEILPVFFKAWEAASEPIDVGLNLHEIVKSIGTRRNPDKPEIAESHSFTTLQVPIDDEIADKGRTLYDAIDDILWTTDNLPVGQQEAYLDHIGDVIILDMKRSNEASSGLGIKIPATWYLDRYLESSVVAIKEMRETKAALQEELDLIEQKRAKIADYQASGAGTKVINGLSLLKTASTYFERSVINSNSTDSHEEQSRNSTHSKVVKELQILTEKITQRLQILDESRKHACEKSEEVSKLYTTAEADSKYLPHHQYSLRGVCSDPKTKYILERSQPGVENESIGVESKDWQWWKITYIGSDAKPISGSKVREIEVSKAAKDESNRALLVYASERAVSYGVEDLPSELRNFVRLDNLNFHAELEKSGSSKPTTPKRKADEAGSDSPKLEHYGSTRSKRNGKISSLKDPSESNLPPPYFSHPPSPPLSGSDEAQTPTRSMKHPKSYDEVIPISLRASPPTIDPSMLLDQDEPYGAGQEMEDRGGMMGIVQAQPGNENRRHGYALGSYVPEINMDDTDTEGELDSHGKPK